MRKFFVNLLDEKINKYMMYFLLVVTPISYSMVTINEIFDIGTSGIFIYITIYTIFISLLTLILEIYDVKYNFQYIICIRFLTLTLILCTWFFIIHSTITILSSILLSIVIIINIIIFLPTLYKIYSKMYNVNTYSNVKNRFSYIYYKAKTIVQNIIEYKILVIVIVLFTAPLLPVLTGAEFINSGELQIEADANISYEQFSTESDKYNLVVSVNNMENSDYLIIKEQKETSPTEILGCSNDYISVESNFNKSEAVNNQKYASRLISTCQIVIVKNLDLGDKVHVYGSINGVENLVDIYEVN